MRKGTGNQERDACARRRRLWFDVMVEKKHAPGLLPSSFFEQKYSYAAIVAFFILYFLTGQAVLLLLAGISILWAVALEFLLGAKEHGMKKEIVETALALLLAAVIWFGSGMLLQTPSPLNAIVSCSMLPHVQRGDMVVLSGDRINAPIEQVGMVSMEGAAVYENGAKAADVKGSFYSYCASNHGKEICKRFVSSPERFSEKKGPLSIAYESCRIVNSSNPSALIKGPCVASVEVNGNVYRQNLSNDVVVYVPQKEEIYSRTGDIIHRALLKLQAPDGNVYVLTWGDNNPILDVQVYDYASGMGNKPVEMQRTKGRILFAIPYLGYLKLAISPVAIATPEGCDRHYAKWDGWKN